MIENHWIILVVVYFNFIIFKTQQLNECKGLKICTVEPPRSGFLRSGHLPRPDMIFYEILTNIIYTGIGENIQHNKKQKKLTIKAGMILVRMSAQCPDLRE